MTGRFRYRIPLGIALLLCMFIAPARTATAGESDLDVSLELVLALDSSVSVDAREFALQRDGLARAFRDPAVVAAIRESGEGGIAVAVVQWGVGLQQIVSVDWTQVRDGATAEELAQAIERSPRLIVGNGTGIARAILFSSGLFGSNGFAGKRRVIDVSGDGRNNSGVHPSAIRDRLVPAGIVINALAILDGDVGLSAFFADHVLGGNAAFVLAAATFDDFADAIRLKLLQEISVPMAEADPPPAVSRVAMSE